MGMTFIVVFARLLTVELSFFYLFIYSFFFPFFLVPGACLGVSSWKWK